MGCKPCAHTIPPLPPPTGEVVPAHLYQAVGINHLADAVTAPGADCLAPGTPDYFVYGLASVTVALLVTKLILASALDLFGDGAFYWLESQHWALAYSDLPPATATFIKLGTSLFGNTTFGVRALFILLAAAIPWLLYYWALVLTTRQDARWVAVLGLCVPMITSLGVLAVPDVLQVTVGLTSMIALERAIHYSLGDNQPAAGQVWRWWIAAGALVGIGLTVHYRFVIVPLGAGLFLLTTVTGRSLLRQRGPWLAVVCALPGLIPILWFNMNHNLAGLEFQFMDRHPWRYDASGWRFWEDQLLATSPLLYGACLASAGHGLLRSKRTQHPDSARLLSLFGLSHILVFGLLSPWMDQQRTNVHWPLLGYLPLLVFLPGILRNSMGQMQRVALWLLAITAGATSLGVLATLVLMTQYADLPQTWRARLVSKMSGHELLAREVQATLTEISSTGMTPLVTDQYYVAAQLKFYLGTSQPIHVLPEQKAERDGRALQLSLWQMGLSDLALPGAIQALALIERTAWTDQQYNQKIRALCARFADVQQVKTLVLFEGEQLFEYLKLESASSVAAGSRHESEICLPAARIYVDRGYPKPFTSIAPGIQHTEGWVYQDDGGVRLVELLVDGEVTGSARYSLPRGDVKAFYPESTDPNHPNVGFKITWSAAGSGGSLHNIAIRITSNNSKVELFEQGPFYLR